MNSFKYLIIGGGMTGDSAVHGIRELDKSGSIGMVSNEPTIPYDRPPLSKKLWKGKSVETIWRDSRNLGAELYLNTEISKIDRSSKKVISSTGEEFGYSKLLLATGASPRRLSTGEGLVNYYRTFSDYESLKSESVRVKDFAIIGGGFIGSEIAAALNMAGNNVSMIFMENGVTARFLPHDLSSFINNYYIQKGIRIFPERSIVDVTPNGNKIKLVFKDNSGKEENIQVHGVVAGLGVLPNTQLAVDCGINVENGILVNDYLQTNDLDIYSAGDVANYFDTNLNVRRRVEHEDNANVMGRAVGENMAGARKEWNYLPYFYSDLFDLGYEAVGELDARLDVYSDWQEPFKKGVVYYMKDGFVRGVLLWNVWEKIPEAREIILSKSKFKPADLSKKIQ